MINKFLRAATIAVLSAALASSGITLAQASPKTTPMANAPGYGTSVRPTKTQWAYIKMAQRTASANNPNLRLNYHTAIKKFGKHTTWRRNFAAGYLGYHSIFNISSAELKKVKAIRKRIVSENKSQAMAVPMDGCSGVTKTVHKTTSKGNETWSYMNSCATSDLIESYSGVSPLGGFFSAVLAAGKANPAGAVICAAITGDAWLEKHQYQHAQNHSSKHAVIVKTIDYGYDPTRGVHYYSTEVVPQ